MDVDLSEQMAEANTCVLVATGGTSPQVSPMACWFDGDAVWMTSPSGSAEVRALRDDPRAAVCVRGTSGDDGTTIAWGVVRVFGLDDPLGLALHSATIAGAMSALALHNPAEVVGYARDAVRRPDLRGLTGRAVLRMRIDEARDHAVPSAAPGVAPALPAQVPADVRRLLVGRREVVVAATEGGLRVMPASWSGSFDLAFGAGSAPPREGERIAAVVQTVGRGSDDLAGVVVHGDFAAGRLVAERVEWWRGTERGEADIPAPVPGGIVIPD